MAINIEAPPLAESHLKIRNRKSTDVFEYSGAAQKVTITQMSQNPTDVKKE